MNKLFAQAAEQIGRADGLLISAGAGMGVDSGLPDFRGDRGFWNAYPALGHLNMSFTSIACPAAFEEAPEIAWGFYGHRLELYRKTQPHAGFQVLRRWSDRARHGSRVFTSNVDGQFQKAGFNPGDVLECHGSIHRLQCLAPCHEFTWSADDLTTDVDAAACKWVAEMPRCPACGAIARPNILMFGDWGWVNPHADNDVEQLEEWLGSLRNPVVIEMGAGKDIPSVRAHTARVARRHDAFVVRLNPRDHAIGDMHGIGLAIGACEGLHAIDQLLS